MRRRRSSRWGIFPIAGWLFTDLLLALAVIFLVASASGTPPKPPPLPCLELSPQSLPFNVDAQALLHDDPGAINSVQQQMRTFPPIQGRRAGLVITYTGTGNPYDIETANAVGEKINEALAKLGQKGFVFVGTSYHDPLLLLGEDLSKVRMEIYLFALPGQCPP